jgi:hypothetical protein
MPQQIQPLGTNPYAEEALRLAEQGRGQEGMGRTAAPVGPNLQDQGGMSKPNVNTQPYNNQRLMEQNMGQNMSSAVPAQQANAVGQMRKQTAETSGAEYKANEFKNSRVAEFLYANDGGNATFQMGLPEVAQKVNQHVAEQKLMANGINPQIPFSSNRFAA